MSGTFYLDLSVILHHLHLRGSGQNSTPLEQGPKVPLPPPRASITLSAALGTRDTSTGRHADRATSEHVLHGLWSDSAILLLLGGGGFSSNFKREKIMTPLFLTSFNAT